MTFPLCSFLCNLLMKKKSKHQLHNQQGKLKAHMCARELAGAWDHIQIYCPDQHQLFLRPFTYCASLVCLGVGIGSCSWHCVIYCVKQ